MTTRLLHGDCVALMASLDAESVDAVVTDPPYGLGFMGREWDNFAPSRVAETMARDTRSQSRKDDPRAGGSASPAMAAGRYDWSAGARFQGWCEAWAVEALRVLKPGGYLVAFGGTRTYHRLACAIEDAGFEIRDSLAWLYGQGFPKSMDLAKAIDRAAGEKGTLGEPRSAAHAATLKRGTLGTDQHHEAWDRPWMHDPAAIEANARAYIPATEAARAWKGWGTALKPAFEPIVLARKPFPGTLAANVAEHGVGGLNIDGTRIGTTVESWPTSRSYGGEEGDPSWTTGSKGKKETQPTGAPPPGRWPANVLLGHAPECEQVGTKRVASSNFAGHERPGPNAIFGAQSDGPRAPSGYADGEGLETVEAWNCAPGCPVAMLDAQSGELAAGVMPPKRSGIGYGSGAKGTESGERIELDGGGASRFFYTAKASRSERNDGLDGMPEGLPVGGADKWTEQDRRKGEGVTRKPASNIHPTVKPLDLMRWLCRLVTPKGGLILDPFLGSGTTMIAALREGFRCIGIEREAEYFAIARRRVEEDDPLFNRAIFEEATP